MIIGVLGRFLPRELDNDYRGSRIALWLFGALVLLKMAVALGCIFNGRQAASSADGIPIDTFGPQGARAVVSMFAVWGLAQVIIGLVCIAALVRYRSFVPFLFALLLVEHAGRKLIFYLLPIAKSAGTPPGFFINAAMFAVELIGLALSLTYTRRDQGRGGAGFPG